MSDKLEAIVAALRDRMGGAAFDGAVKLKIADEGVIRIAGNDVTTDDGDADCTISASMDTFRDMFAGDLGPTAAFMSGKVEIDGDMGVAMKLGQLFG